MKDFFTGITPRERRFAVAGIVVALVFFMPFLAFADPVTVEGEGPGKRTATTRETPLPVSRGDSCADMLPKGTPSYVVCEWMTPPQDAAAVASFWGANDGANMEAARPLPQTYVRCNQKSDLSRDGNCRGGQTLCEERPDGWYRCQDGTTGKTTYERHVNGEKQVRTTPPSGGAAPSAGPPPSDESPGDRPQPKPSAQPSDQPSDRPAPATGRLAEALGAARSAGLRTWVETDLADDFRAGEAQFRAALDRLAGQAAGDGVVGVKFADYLGFRDFTGATQVKRFVSEATAYLRGRLPGKRLAIGVVVPELGCGSAEACVRDLRARYPLVTRSRVDDYVKSSGVDRVYVASGLFGKSYGEHGITPAKAAQAQWMNVKALGWDTLAQIGSREYGLTHSGETSPWDRERAGSEVDARVGNAIRYGAQTVTLWGHRIAYEQEHRRLLDAGLAENEVWRALTDKGLRNRLSVVFDPADPEVGVREDLRALGKGVSEVFVLS
ncbi:hypothetical protein [Nonomuraea longicatena]|uniref:Uncharacterized protein n=1 Tax=Nonomuraea longicatena TaxID=83682 RepID=A0ABP3Z088_9ACTN